MNAIEIIRIVAPEFASMRDDEVMDWVHLTRPLVSRKQFGRLYEQALAYLTCHKMKLAGNGEDASKGLMGVNSLTAGLSMSSVSDGGTSISFGSGISSVATATGADAAYGLTIYGMQYLQLRRQVIVPITIA